MSQTAWMPTRWMPTLLLPEPWATDKLPPTRRGPWRSIHCGDTETAAEVLTALARDAEVARIVAEWDEAPTLDVLVALGPSHIERIAALYLVTQETAP